MYVLTHLNVIKCITYITPVFPNCVDRAQEMLHTQNHFYFKNMLLAEKPV